MNYNYKLESKIPGVRVTLTKNPLNAKIELSESAKREFALLVWTEDLVENYFLTASFYLTPRSGTMIDGVYVPRESDSKEAASWLKSGEEIWYENWYGEKAGENPMINIPRVERILQSDLVQSYLAELNSEHSGDCTAFASSCCRCHAESILGIDTLPVGKHIGYRMRGLYLHHFGTPEEIARRDKANEEFKAKYGHNVHWVPTFDEHDAAAREFFEEHQRLVRLQDPQVTHCL